MQLRDDVNIKEEKEQYFDLSKKIYQRDRLKDEIETERIPFQSIKAGIVYEVTHYEDSVHDFNKDNVKHILVIHIGPAGNQESEITYLFPMSKHKKEEQEPGQSLWEIRKTRRRYMSWKIIREVGPIAIDFETLLNFPNNPDKN